MTAPAYTAYPDPPRVRQHQVKGGGPVVEEHGLVMPKPSGKPYWWDDPGIAEDIDQHILMRRELGDAFEGALLIEGPAGSGKSQGVFEAVRRFNARHGTTIQITKMDCATVTDAQKWFGRREVDHAGTRHERSDFVTGVERGDVILLDDVRRLHPHLHNPIMSLLDGSNAVRLSDLNLVVTRNPQTVFIGTANTGAQFGGQHRMDPAMRERFPYTLVRPWPPLEDEIRILVSRTGVDRDGARNLVTIARKSRQQYEDGELRLPISTRTLVSAAWLVASGKTEKEAMEMTAIPLYDPTSAGLSGGLSEQAQVRQIVDGKGL